MSKPLACLRLSILVCLGSFLSYCTTTRAQASDVSETQLKAAYLIHLSEFTTWPSEKTQLPSFNICITNGSSLGEPLEQIRNRIIKEKPLNIMYDVNIDQVNTCHVFYVEEKNKKIFQQSLQKNPTVLTVSSDTIYPNFSKEGGIIEYYLDNEYKVRMRVNLKAMEQARLTMSSKVLRLMEIINAN